MSPYDVRADKSYCPDKVLGYDRSRTQILPGSCLTFDESYRLAQLPLVAPEHPLVLKENEDLGYYEGKHELVFSLAIPIPAESVFGSTSFLNLKEDLQKSSFAQKISWEMLAERKNKLHATICGSLSRTHAPIFDNSITEMLAKTGPIKMMLKGLFSGDKNLGRLYIRLYPEIRNGRNMLTEIQRICGCSETDVYLIGVFNLVEELTPAETMELNDYLNRWWDVPINFLDVNFLWLLGTHDDLLIDSKVVQNISLV